MRGALIVKGLMSLVLSSKITVLLIFGNKLSLNFKICCKNASKCHQEWNIKKGSQKGQQIAKNVTYSQLM